MHEPLTWQNAEYADGPKLVAWLEAEGIHFDKNDYPSEDRRVRYWQNGEAAKLDTIDRMLCKAGRHICELPDDVWREAKPQRGPRQPQHVKDEVIGRLREGATCEEEARRIGVAAATVRDWAKAAGISEERRRAREERKERVIEMLRSGMRPTDIHRETGVAKSTLDRWKAAA